MIKRIRNFARGFYNKSNSKKLKNRDFSVIASNCNGAFLLHDLGMRFNSPFVNLWVKPKDFIKFLSDMSHYLDSDMTFVEEEGIDYPIGVIDDIRIYFQHYHSPEEAKSKWDERSKRINFDNLFIMFTDRDNCSYEDLKAFDALPFENKVVFTHIAYPEIKSAYYLKGWESEVSVGSCFEYKSSFSFKKYYDDFDYIGWFNGKR